MNYIAEESFEERFLRRLNPQQREAAKAVDGSILLLATPGSGKTTVLVTRLGYMICTRGIQAQSILTMTYTRAATGDMKRRFVSLFGAQAAENLEFRTINGVSAKIIQRYCALYNRTPFALLDNESEQKKLLRELYQRINREYAEESLLRDIQTQITYVKNQMLSPEEINALKSGIEHFPELYWAYQTEMEKRALMDYDDQMVYAYKVLRRCPELLDALQEQFRYICMDEAQDSSKIQHEIVKLLASKYHNLFLVGDEDQSIYGFRAACPEALLRFEQDHPGGRVLLMEENYRSTPQIIQLANHFIVQNEERREKTIQPTRSGGRAVQVIQCRDRRAQYRLVLEMARQCREETAVLFRTNDSALPLIDQLERSGMDYRYRKSDGLYFFTHRVVTDLLNILRFAAQPCSAELFLRIYYKFDAKIPKKAAQEAVRRSERSGNPILEELMRAADLKRYVKENVAGLLENLPLLLEERAETAIRRVWEAMHYRRYAEERGLDTGKYFILCMLAEGVPTVQALFDKLEALKATIAAHRNSESCPLTLSTIHSSKGLEYDRVYLLDVLDGVFPPKPESALETEEDRRNYEEERRLCYVAMTRARNELHLFRCGEESCFTEELCSYLPAPEEDEDAFFHFLRLPQLGKRYTDREWGRGEIVAQCEDRFTIVFADEKVRTLTLEQMAQRRDRSVRAPSKPRKKRQGSSGQARSSSVTASVLEGIKRGVSIHHKAFGPGEVEELRGNIVTIRFRTGETKQFVLPESLMRGYLSL